MDCCGYCRVSTDEQTEGTSLDSQRSKIVAYADLHDHTLLDVHMDVGVSGKSVSNRPELLAIIDTICERKGILVVYSISRLGRNTRDLIDIAERLAASGAQFASIVEHVDTTTASGRMFFKLMAVLAEFERDTIIERTNAAIGRKREKNEVVGNLPYGFGRSGDNLVVCEREADGLRIILSKMQSCGYAEIARSLEAANHKTRSGGALWDRGVIRRIVKFHRSKAGLTLRSRHKIP